MKDPQLTLLVAGMIFQIIIQIGLIIQNRQNRPKVLAEARLTEAKADQIEVSVIDRMKDDLYQHMRISVQQTQQTNELRQQFDTYRQEQDRKLREQNDIADVHRKELVKVNRLLEDEIKKRTELETRLSEETAKRVKLEEQIKTERESSAREMGVLTLQLKQVNEQVTALTEERDRLREQIHALQHPAGDLPPGENNEEKLAAEGEANVS